MRQWTEKQKTILTLAVKANPDGSFLDLDQLCEALGKTAAYDMKPPTKDALQFSIRYMIQHGLLEKKDPEPRRGARRRIIAPTYQGFIEYQELRKP